MHIWAIIGIGIGLLVALWIGWTLYVLYGIEHPDYTVVKQYDAFEIREYEPYTIAYVDIASENRALTSGFSILAGYIFGGNQGSKSIAMTAPVIESESIKIAMTAPVTEQAVGDTRRVSFIMPKQYSAETLPLPNDDRIQFEDVPSKRYAAFRFGWYATQKRVADKERAFGELLNAADVTPLSPPIYAGYNDPWSFPLLLRNEILVEVQ